MGKEEKSTTITIRLSVALKKQVFEAMVRERRSLTNFVVCALEDRIAAKKVS
jgi:uncharacterized protein (DUF1778 family)